MSPDEQTTTPDGYWSRNRVTIRLTERYQSNDTTVESYSFNIISTTAKSTKAIKRKTNKMKPKKRTLKKRKK